MKNLRSKIAVLGMTASSLLMTSFSQAAFIVTVSSSGTSGGFTYYNVSAVDNGNTGGNNTGTQLELIDSTITAVGTGTTGAILVQLTDVDNDGVADANVIGAMPTGKTPGSAPTTTNFVGTYERFTSPAGFSVAFVGDSSTVTASNSSANYDTDPNSTGHATQSLDAAFSAGTVHSLEVAGTGNVADTTAVVFAHVVLPTGTAGTISGQLGGNIGGVYNFTTPLVAVAVPEPASLSLLGFGALGLLRRRARRVMAI